MCSTNCCKDGDVSRPKQDCSRNIRRVFDRAHTNISYSDRHGQYVYSVCRDIENRQYIYGARVQINSFQNNFENKDLREI